MSVECEWEERKRSHSSETLEGEQLGGVCIVSEAMLSGQGSNGQSFSLLLEPGSRPEKSR